MLHLNYSTPHVCVKLKISISAFRISALVRATWYLCDSLAIVCFTFHRRLSHYEDGAVQREKNSARSGKHTKNHLNRKCKDNESAIHNTRPLCLPRIAELYSPADREKPFSVERYLPLAKLFSWSRYEPTIPLNNNNEIQTAIHLIRDYDPHSVDGLFICSYFSVFKSFLWPNI